MKLKYTLPVWLWALQAVTGAFLVLYIIIHTIDNALILSGVESFDEMLAFWHETLPSWFYVIMVIGLVGIFVLHTANGIRIASKPYKDIDKSWQHVSMMKHSGTFFWYLQVITGSLIAIFGIWHLIVQHGGEATHFAWQSAERVSVIIYLIYILFIGAIMFHAFNGTRAVIIKLGFMTDKGREAILIGFMAMLFIVFFFVGIFSMARFIPSAGEMIETDYPELYDVDLGNDIPADIHDEHELSTIPVDETEITPADPVEEDPADSSHIHPDAAGDMTGIHPADTGSSDEGRDD